MLRNRFIIIISIFSFIGLPISASIEADGVLPPDAPKYWVFFKDKEGFSNNEMEQKLMQLEKQATSQNIRRRMVVNQGERLFDSTDLPVNQTYLDSVKSLGLEIRRVSRWLNAASVAGTPAAMGQIPFISFIDSIAPVKVFKQSLPQYDSFPEAPQKLQVRYDFDYGPSFEQVAQINVPQLHNQGLSGQGILIAVFDTGFDPDHSALADLDLVHTYDFINNDSDVKDGLDIQRSHGTSVLSVLAGHEPGQIIGPAFGASFCLAKTEIVGQEIRQEEDNFIAALEWADSLGCRIVSASLGYIDWYMPADLDGNTALVTIASDLAVKKGIAIIVAAGNEGPGPTTIMAPADGDSVIAAGGVLIDDEIWQGSSRGPTADGRVKPDICANSVFVYQANYLGGYYRGSGTSFSTPLIAGSVALLLEHDPSLTPVEVRQAIWTTARRNAGVIYPNNDYGYGILDAAAAAGFAAAETERSVLVYPNPFKENIYFSCHVSHPGAVKASIHAIDGVKVWGNEIDVVDSTQTMAWNGRNSRGEDVASGVYILHIVGPGIETDVKLVKIE